MLDRRRRLDWSIRDLNDERNQWSFQAAIPLTSGLDGCACHLTRPQNSSAPDHVVGLAGKIVIANRRPHRSLTTFHRKAVFGADKWRRDLFATPASAVVQGNLAFLGDIEDPVFKNLGNFSNKDSAKPINPGHYITLFAMLLPSIIYTAFTSSRSSEKYFVHRIHRMTAINALREFTAPI